MVIINKPAKNIKRHLDGTKILAQDNGNLLIFKYGVDGVIGFTYEGVGEYFYKKNIFGDIIGIIDSNKQEIAKYVYDAWGNHKTYVLNNSQYVDISENLSYINDGLNNKFIAELNPFRYRGYYYDVETGLYYLNSRYYDPEIGRFINADDISYLDPESINGLNLYAYCINNPTNLSDESGCSWWDWLFAGFLALATITLAVLTAGAIIAAAPAVAGYASTLVSSIGLASLAGTAATVISIGAGVLAVTTIGLGINNAISTLSGFNPLASLIGQDAYNIVQSTIGILGYSYIMMGSMLPYPSTGNSSPQNLEQQLAMKEAKLNPTNHSSFTINMKDPRMPGWLGWQKYTQLVKFKSGIHFDIHYVGNKYLNWIKVLATWFDFKIK